MKQNVSFETARNIVKCLLAVAAIVCVIALILGDDAGNFVSTAALIAVVCLVLAVILVVTCLKCPFCGRMIISKCLVVKNCPHCGRNLVTGLKGKKKKH